MTPQQSAIVIDKTVQGYPCRDIAPIVGLSHTAVNNHQNKPETQAQIAKIKAQLLDQAAQQSADNIIYAVQGYKQGIRGDDGKIDTQLRDHGYKASVNILQSIGLLPSHTAPTLIQINANNIQLSPQMERFMAMSAPAGLPPDAEEIIDL
jgi:hypothetical protein